MCIHTHTHARTHAHCHAHILSPTYVLQGDTRHPFGFVVEVESISCNTTVLIRSPVQVANQLVEPCLVAIAAGHQLTTQEAARAVSLEADDKYSLPLDSAHDGHVFVKLKNRRWAAV